MSCWNGLRTCGVLGTVVELVDGDPGDQEYQRLPLEHVEAPVQDAPHEHRYHQDLRGSGTHDLSGKVTSTDALSCRLSTQSLPYQTTI